MKLGVINNLADGALNPLAMSMRLMLNNICPNAALWRTPVTICLHLDTQLLTTPLWVRSTKQFLIHWVLYLSDPCWDKDIVNDYLKCFTQFKADYISHASVSHKCSNPDVTGGNPWLAPQLGLCRQWPPSDLDGLGWRCRAGLPLLPTALDGTAPRTRTKSREEIPVWFSKYLTHSESQRGRKPTSRPYTDF